MNCCDFGKYRLEKKLSFGYKLSQTVQMFLLKVEEGLQIAFFYAIIFLVCTDGESLSKIAKRALF